MNWNPTKLGPDIALSNDNLTVTRTDSSGWGCQVTEQCMTSGAHYYEFTIDRNGSTCLLLGVADQDFTNLTSKSSGANVYALQSDGDMYFHGTGKGQIHKYEQGDKLGVLINVEERYMVYFKNGQKQTKENLGPFPDTATELYLQACFGGSNQHISINNDPECRKRRNRFCGSTI